MNRELLVYPHYPNNPWQAMMYQALPGLDVRVVEDPFTLGEIDPERAPLLHLNWTAPLSQNAPDIAESWRRVEGFLAGLDRYRAAGGRLIWSVHNVLPHETVHRGPELFLCRSLAERADTVLIMNPDTADLTAPLYRLPPERTVHIPHPSYLGRFPDDGDDAAARTRLGIAPEETVFLLLGVLRPYKGIEALTASVAALPRDGRRYRLLLAGEIGAGYDRAQLEHLVAADDRITAHIGFVPEEDVAGWMRAADAVVLPYRQSLNVSVASLAASFGRPVALRAGASARALLAEDWVFPLPAGPDELFTAELVALAESLETEPRGDAARRFAEQTAPERIARAFAEELRRLQERPASPSR